MPRRGITLSEEQWRDVKARAAARGLTVSAYIAAILARAHELGPFSGNHAVQFTEELDGTIRVLDPNADAVSKKGKGL